MTMSGVFSSPSVKVAEACAAKHIPLMIIVPLFEQWLLAGDLSW